MKGARDLDQLLLGDGQLPTRVCGRERGSQPLQHGRQPSSIALAVDDAARVQLRPR